MTDAMPHQTLAPPRRRDGADGADYTGGRRAEVISEGSGASQVDITAIPTVITDKEAAMARNILGIAADGSVQPNGGLGVQASPGEGAHELPPAQTATPRALSSNLAANAKALLETTRAHLDALDAYDLEMGLMPDTCEANTLPQPKVGSTHADGKLDPKCKSPGFEGTGSWFVD